MSNKYDCEKQEIISDYARKTYEANRLALEVLEQELFINKPCISSGVCKHDKNEVLNKIRTEIKALTDGAETEHIWNVDALAIIDKYKESEE